MKDELLIIDGFATGAEAKVVVDAFNRSHHQSGRGFFANRVMWASAYPETEEPARAVLRAWAHEARRRLQEFYVEPALYCDGIQTVVWPVGMVMPPHQDDRHPDPNERHGTPWRFLASVIYLNDDYEGGEIYFPERGKIIKPIQGQLIAFPGAWWHGVMAVSAGLRFTAPAWYSRDSKDGDPFLAFRMLTIAP